MAGVRGGGGKMENWVRIEKEREAVVVVVVTGMGLISRCASISQKKNTPERGYGVD